MPRQRKATLPMPARFRPFLQLGAAAIRACVLPQRPVSPDERAETMRAQCYRVLEAFTALSPTDYPPAFACVLQGIFGAFLAEQEQARALIEQAMAPGMDRTLKTFTGGRRDQ